MYKFTFLLPILLLLIVFCSTKEESMQATQEAQEIEVLLPETDWQKSISYTSVAHDALVDPLIENEIFKELSQISNLMIQKQHNQNADFQLKHDIQREEDIWTVHVRVEESATGEIIYENTLQSKQPGMIGSQVIEEQVVAEKLGMHISREESDSKRYIGSEVHAIYTRAVVLLAENTYESTNQAVQLFKQALRQDPEFARASVGLVHSYQQVIHNGWDKNVAFIQLAQDAALKAVEIDPDLAEAHEVMADVYLLRHNMKEAEKSYLKAIGLNSNLSNSWKGLARIYTHYGLYEPAKSAYEKAILLNPEDDSALLSNALINMSLRDYSAARNELKRILKSYPHYDFVHTWIALIDFYQRDLVLAKKSIQKGLNSEDYVTVSHAIAAMIYAKEGDLDKALSEVELEVKPHVKTDASLAVAVAAVYALIGQKGNAVIWLQKALDWGYFQYVWIQNDPNFQNLKGDERFDSLMQELHNRWQEKRLAYLME